MNKKFIFSMLFYGLSLLNAEVVNNIVAVVENEPITNYELNMAIRANGVSAEQAMEILISNKLLSAEIKKRGVIVSPYEVESRIGAIAAQNNLNLDQFKEAIRKDGINYDVFYANTKKSMEDEKLYSEIFREVSQSITPENVRNFYEKNKSLFTTFESATITRYITKNPNLLNEILRNPNAKVSGVKIFKANIKNSQMDQGLRYVLINTDEGKFSHIIPTTNGYEMFFINSKNGVNTVDFEQVQERAIEAYTISERQRKVKEFNDRLRSEATIKVLNYHKN